MKTVHILFVGALGLLSAVACAPSSEVATEQPSESAPPDSMAQVEPSAQPAPSGPIEDVVCEDTVGAVIVMNVQVPSGATCNLTDTKVRGDIIVGPRARLTTNNVKASGNLQADKAAQITLNEGTRFENITLTESGETSIKTTRVMGDLVIENSPRPLAIDGATVHGQLKVVGNQNGVQIHSTRVDGNLTCEGNTLAPEGSRNFIQGNKQGQCSDIPG